MDIDFKSNLTSDQIIEVETAIKSGDFKNSIEVGEKFFVAAVQLGYLKPDFVSNQFFDASDNKTDFKKVLSFSVDFSISKKVNIDYIIQNKVLPAFRVKNTLFVFSTSCSLSKDVKNHLVSIFDVDYVRSLACGFKISMLIKEYRNILELEENEIKNHPAKAGGLNKFQTHLD